ncbi:Rdx family protein [Planctomycetes bacterium Pla163]|uniref:Rdx family protein n=1 Tax=Rohdeia mirabilis TaxID=2528008 RepID=A0A518CVD7_9BACT|nr:Rdx family protein [Planctomycetes bacterium Pla163]
MKGVFPDTDFTFDVVKGDNGAFEVSRDGQLIFSKLREKRFPAYQEIPNRFIEMDALR